VVPRNIERSCQRRSALFAANTGTIRENGREQTLLGQCDLGRQTAA